MRDGRRTVASLHRVVNRLLLAPLTLLAVASVGACGTAPAMTEADAADYTLDALEAAGLDDVSVDDVVAAQYGTDGTPVWQTESTVDGGEVLLAIERDGRYVLFVRDVAVDGGPLLTDEQVDVLEAFSANPAADRARRRVRGPGVVAAGLLVVVAVGLFAGAVSGQLRDT